MMYTVLLHREPDHLARAVHWLEAQGLEYDFVLEGQRFPNAKVRMRVLELLHDRPYKTVTGEIKTENLGFAFHDDEFAMTFKLMWS